MRANEIRNIRNESDAVLSTVDIFGGPVHGRSGGGVVSKKFMGACMTEVIVLRWRDFNEGSDGSGDKEHDGQGDPQSGINGHLTKYVGMNNSRKRRRDHVRRIWRVDWAAVLARTRASSWTWPEHPATRLKTGESEQALSTSTASETGATDLSWQF
jgi:hypothetical protein